jgi:hypothetical protein
LKHLISVFIKPAAILASIGRIELNRMLVIISFRKGLGNVHNAPIGMRTYRICTATLVCLVAADLDQRCPKVDQAGTPIFKKWYTSMAAEYQSAHSQI